MNIVEFFGHLVGDSTHRPFLVIHIMPSQPQLLSRG